MEQIYLGRIVAVANTPQGKAAAMYRVSSRSFPNRMAKITQDTKRVSIVPKAGHETDIAKNPYIAYNCARIIGNLAILANGSQTDPIAEKIAMGIPPRDAIALSLLAMDYEKDEYNTPRIVAVADSTGGTAWLGTVRADGIDIQSFVLEPGTALHLSTYEHSIPAPHRLSAFPAETAAAACDFIINGGVFANFTNPVTAVAAVSDGNGGFELAIRDL